MRAVTADSRVGQTTNELVSTKPLFVSLQTPRFFVVGDQVTVGATIFNNSENTLKVNVSLDAKGVDQKSKASQAIEIEGRQQAYVTWDVIVHNDVERVDMTATATSGPFTDASKPALGTLPGQGIPVLHYSATETVGTSGTISTADSVTENIQLPTSLNYDDANLSIEVSPSLAASMTSSFAYLEEYPYLCMKQTVSRFLPNVITTRALKTAGLPLLKFKSKMETAEAALTRADQERQQWEQHCGYIGLKPEQFGATFKGLDGATYRIIGIAPNRPKFPVIASRTSDGKRFKFTEHINSQFN